MAGKKTAAKKSGATQAKGAKALTPMMKQYMEMRRELSADVLLLFRLGDFYEMFFEDAKIAAVILDVALTKRNDIPMCGVPHHAARGYIAKLIEAGKRVAIAEQVGEVQTGKLVKREIAQVISAGTVDDMSMLESGRANYLAAAYELQSAGKDSCYGLSFVEHSTGEYRVAEYQSLDDLRDQLTRVAPSEVLYIEGEEELAEVCAGFGATPIEAYHFIEEEARHHLLQHFKLQSLDGLGVSEMSAGVSAAGALLSYLVDILHRRTEHLSLLRPLPCQGHLLIDASTQEHLDLLPVKGGGNNQSVLLHSLDQCKTPMGARTLRHWMLHPLIDATEIAARQDFIAELLSEASLLETLREELAGIRDLERCLGRLSQGSGNARDMHSLGTSLAQLPQLKEGLATGIGATGLAQQLNEEMLAFPELVALLEKALAEEPPATLRDGGIFADGYHAELDELRAAGSKGRQWLAELQVKEAERTGIKSLKIKYNAVFGYFIEITKANLSAVPPEYHRKQTTANAERFITEELKEMEGKILGAEERGKALEAELFAELREKVLEQLSDIQQSARAVAQLDVLCSLAVVARLHNYIRPVINEGVGLSIVEGRHPVLDQQLSEERFVPNDTDLSGKARLTILTGPNMAGKSTYIRQVALLVLMAQMGSFIPASFAEIGLVDRIFTRVGASDNLAKGQSTFMVEMNETAQILNNATERSLVILDEIGRGTATFDGLSIAWSVAEYLHDELEARALFATHYHELTELAVSRAAVSNAHVAVREDWEKIVFLRRVLPGCADKSYGIQVARLAGLPPQVLERAAEILAKLEGEASSPQTEPMSSSNTKTAAVKKAKKGRAKVAATPSKSQLSLFEG